MLAVRPEAEETARAECFRPNGIGTPRSELSDNEPVFLGRVADAL
jgi:hypothetical protein